MATTPSETEQPGADHVDAEQPGTRRARRHARAARGGPGWAAVGVLGELLMTVGVLLFAFLVWQLWWTDVQGNRTQATVVAELEQPTPSPSEDGGNVAEPRRDSFPEAIPTPAHAETFATLTVPRWNGEPSRPISYGVDRESVLDVLGIGQYPDTAAPGQVGNFAIAGHRTTFGKPFNRVEELQVGDPLVVWLPQTRTWFVYRVTQLQVVAPTQVDVIAPVPGQPGAEATERMITLTTCHPMFSARERFIVHGVLDYWADGSDGAVPVELLPADLAPTSGGA